MTKNNEKECFRLWWEYLKRSKYYRLYCGWQQEVERNPKVPIPDEFLVKDDNIPYYIPPYGCLKGKKLKRNILGCEFNYSKFGNVHSDTPDDSFEEWWNSFLSRINTYINGCVQDYADIIGERMSIIEDSFRAREARDPTLKEFKKLLHKDVLTQCISHVTLSDLHIIAKSVVEKGVSKEFLKFYRKKQRSRFSVVPGQYSPLRARVKEAKWYLRVYDLREEGLIWKDVVAQLSPGSNVDDVRPDFIRDYKKAENIIKEVETGTFLGKHI